MASHRTNKTEKARIVSEMADYIQNHGDNCTRETMLLQFSQGEVDAHFADARAEVERRSNERKAA